ncbi:MAG: hypothetical protein JSS67_09290 [Bacteroidetes bacterium]|nr:hypothetical protein [Bacteroidota bacterium]
MQFLRRLFIPAILITSLLYACNSTEIGDSKDVNPESIYIDYQVLYNENSDSVDCFFQYRFGGKAGTTLVLTPPSHVNFNGENIQVDSSLLLGAFYRKRFLRTGFTGENTVQFTDNKNQMHEELFNFKPLSCTKASTSFKQTDSLQFTFDGVSDKDTFLVEISDTSSVSPDMDSILYIKNNQLLFPASMFSKLSPGMIRFKFQKKQYKPLKNPLAEGGQFLFQYILNPIEIKMDRP